MAEVVEHSQQLLQAPADLGIVFIAAAYASEYSRLMPLLQERLSVSTLIGCGGSGIIGTTTEGEVREVEGSPALSLTLVQMPDIDIRAFHISASEIPDLDSPPSEWMELIGVPSQDKPQFILLADAFSSKINDLLQGLDFAYPGSVKVGGLASGGAMGNQTGLFCNYQLYQEGTVGVALSGDIHLETIVAQGCRPIGQPYRVTKGERNVLLELAEQEGDSSLNACDGKVGAPLEVLQKLLEKLNEADRQLAQHSLFVGVARDEFKQHLESGDFLIRHLLGVDPRVGAIAIGDRVRPGQRIQFHLRDAQTSAEDLEILLQKHQKASPGTQEVGALMFSCLGRGEGLYGQPNFDSRMLHRYVGNIPIGGFFCSGEIGPVGGSTFLHGYTSVFGICRQ